MSPKIHKFNAMFRARMHGVAHGFARLLPRPSITTRTHRSERPIERVVVFARLPNPTLDYYLTARLAAPCMPPSQVVDIRDPMISDLEAEGTFVVICRYANRRVISWIEKHETMLAGVGFFTDDDLGAVITGRDASLGYRLFLYRRGLAPLRRLNQHIDFVWTATPALAESLGESAIHVMPPAPHPTTWTHLRAAATNDPDPTVRIAYHATGVHRREHSFLLPIITEVLRLRPHVVFEVTADARARGPWEGMDRVTVLEPTSWPEYLDRTRRESADVVVVPLVRSRANQARAGTKRIDVVRLGAAGIFSSSNAYGTALETGEVLLPNRRKLWIETLLTLIDDPASRARAAAASRRVVEAMARQADHGIPEIARRIEAATRRHLLVEVAPSTQLAPVCDAIATPATMLPC